MQATVRSGSAAAKEQGDIKKEVSIQAAIIAGNMGGFGIEYHGGPPAMISNISAEWMP